MAVSGLLKTSKIDIADGVDDQEVEGKLNEVLSVVKEGSSSLDSLTERISSSQILQEVVSAMPFWAFMRVITI